MRPSRAAVGLPAMLLGPPIAACSYIILFLIVLQHLYVVCLFFFFSINLYYGLSFSVRAKLQILTGGQLRAVATRLL